MIHEDQTNIRALCELADFIDSGFQSFREQSKIPARKLTQAAFFSGASLVLKLLEHFQSCDYSEQEVQFLKGLLIHEVNEFMTGNRMALEWEPHVPSGWKQ